MEKYKEIIPEYKAFQKEVEKDPVASVRRNNLKARPDFEEKLAKDFEVEKSSWNKDVYRLGRIDNPGTSMLHWRGEYYVQEESATAPVEILNPKPGDHVLDTCSAPGGKTTQIADKINNTGIVVANEKSGQRMKSLHANVYRTGAFSANTLNLDGRRIPEDTEYDKVLVDAPCSGEGNNCRRKEKAASEQQTKDISKLQVDLLKKALNLVKPRGTLVYSTCTFSPWENEQVVSKALNDTTSLERIKLDFNHCRGLESFEGEEFGSEMDKTVRIYPHHLKSGGMYVAKFRKKS